MANGVLARLSTKPRGKMVFLCVCLFISLLFLGRQFPRLVEMLSNNPDDFLPLWETVRANLNGINPFNPVKIVNPPWIMALIIPFGIMGYPLGRLLWLCATILLIFWSADRLWQQYGGAPNQRWVAWIVAFAFFPTVRVLKIGQLTAIVLFGLVVFSSVVHDKKKWWIAGSSLIFVSLKPQLVYLFWFALLLWVIQHRRWQLLAGGAIAITGAMLISMVSNRALLSHFLTGVLNYPISQFITPTFGAYLRFLFGAERFWLQFLPAIFGLIWLLLYWNKLAKQWAWPNHLPALVMVSILTTPYAWTYDQVLLIIPAVQAAGWLSQGAPMRLIIPAGGLYFLVSIVGLVLAMFLLDYWLVWMAPAYFLIYLWVGNQHAEEVRLAAAH